MTAPGGGIPRCEECGFGGDVERADLLEAIDVAPDRWGRALPDDLSGHAAILRRRPAPAVWSALEYVAHTRDAVAWYEDRIRSVLDRPGVTLEGFDWDAACEARRYRDEDPEDARAGLAAACSSLSVLLQGLDDQAWATCGVGSADGGRRSVALLAGRAAHELHHHLLDVRRALPR